VQAECHAASFPANILKSFAAWQIFPAKYFKTFAEWQIFPAKYLKVLPRGKSFPPNILKVLARYFPPIFKKFFRVANLSRYIQWHIEM
jgi:hypothetical protein